MTLASCPSPPLPRDATLSLRRRLWAGDRYRPGSLGDQERRGAPGHLPTEHVEARGSAGRRGRPATVARDPLVHRRRRASGSPVDGDTSPSGRWHWSDDFGSARARRRRMRARATPAMSNHSVSCAVLHPPPTFLLAAPTSRQQHLPRSGRVWHGRPLHAGASFEGSSSAAPHSSRRGRRHRRSGCRRHRHSGTPSPPTSTGARWPRHGGHCRRSGGRAPPVASARRGVPTDAGRSTPKIGRQPSLPQRLPLPPQPPLPPLPPLPHRPRLPLPPPPLRPRQLRCRSGRPPPGAARPRQR